MKWEDSEQTHRHGPLQSIKVVDASSIVAAPLATGLMADLGAQVIKVELPERGDGLRALRPHKDGISLWSKVVNRNKDAITLDLRRDEGRALLMRLIKDADVFAENFRPGTLEKWGISPEVLWEVNPRLTILRVSAFGQDGPYAKMPGFARIADAMSGFLSICGYEDEAPLHPGHPIADSITGLFGAFGIVAALYEKKLNPSAKGQVVSVSLFESMFRILDFLAIEYDQLGEVRKRAGNRNPYASPGNCYQSRDGKWVTVAASTQAMFERLMRAIGEEDLISDPRFATNTSRLENDDELDTRISSWFAKHDVDAAMDALHAHSATAAKVKDISDLFTDPQVSATEMLVKVGDPDLGDVRMQGVTPKFSRTPGQVRRPGREMGADNRNVYVERLGLSEDELKELITKKVI